MILLILKVVVGLLIGGCGLLQFGLSHWWKDRRTKVYRVVRKLVFSVLVLSAGAGALVLVIEGAISLQASRQQQRKLQDIEGFASGALTPELSMELYVGPNHPTPPTLNTTPEFPGIVLVKIQNPSEYPIYDVSMFMESWGTNGMNQTAQKFNSEPRPSATLLSSADQMVVLPADIQSPWMAYTFYVHTRRGSTKHDFRFALLSSGWEHAKQVLNLGTTNVLLTSASPRFPRDRNGRPNMSVKQPEGLNLPVIVQRDVAGR